MKENPPTMLKVCQDALVSRIFSSSYIRDAAVVFFLCLKNLDKDFDICLQ